MSPIPGAEPVAPGAAHREGSQPARICELSPSLQGFAERSNTMLLRALPDSAQPPVPLHEAMHYALMGGGKRMRPLLVYATGSAFAAPLEHLDASAVAVEMIHAYSLVHDDLPAMDDDAMRRGRPTCHIVFGEAMAILAGDALQALAFEVLAREHAAPIKAEVRLEMMRILGDACGSHGMAGGQALDLSAVGQRLGVAELERMHVFKTGALIRASVRLGALAAGCEDRDVLAALEHYGHCVGLAFQIRDDILDVEGQSAHLGKTAGKDAAQDKPTYPAILGMQASHRHLAELIDSALQSIAPLGDAGCHLRDLARFVADRQN